MSRSEWIMSWVWDALLWVVTCNESKTQHALNCLALIEEHMEK